MGLVEVPVVVEVLVDEPVMLVPDPVEPVPRPAPLPLPPVELELLYWRDPCTKPCGSAISSPRTSG